MPLSPTKLAEIAEYCQIDIKNFIDTQQALDELPEDSNKF